MAVISTYKTYLEDQLKEGVKLDENYQKLQAKVAENVTESLSTGYSINEKGLILYKIDCMYLTYLKLSCKS